MSNRIRDWGRRGIGEERTAKMRMITKRREQMSSIRGSIFFVFEEDGGESWFW